MENVTYTTTDNAAAMEQRFLQPLWDLRKGYEEWLMSPLFPVFISIAYYLALCIPLMLIDMHCSHCKWYQKYKIQPDKEVTMPLIWDTLTLTVLNHVLFILPSAMAQWVWTPPTLLPELAPPLWEFIWQQVAGVFIFDFQYFIWHYTHHKVRFLYGSIHSVHHRYSSPFGWVTEYLHPIELTLIGLFTTTNTWFFKSHCLTTWSYMLLIIFISVEAHTGFDFPFMLHRLDPTGIYGGAPYHDMHHQKPLTNFQPFFCHFDRLLGTYCPPMTAGGVKSKALLAWERKYRETKKQG